MNTNRVSAVLGGNRLVFFLWITVLSSPTAGMAQFHAYRAALGIRFEYVSLGGDQFSNLTNGVGADGFLRVPLDRHFAVEVGAAATGHREELVCVFGRPCIPTRQSLILSVYVAPAIRHPVPGTGLVAYSALRMGVLFGDFQDNGPGVELGGIVGGAIPVLRNLSADVSIVGGLVYVGTSLPRSAFGRRLMLRAGLAYALRDAAGGRVRLTSPCTRQALSF